MKALTNIGLRCVWRWVGLKLLRSLFYYYYSTYLHHLAAPNINHKESWCRLDISSELPILQRPMYLQIPGNGFKSDIYASSQHNSSQAGKMQDGRQALVISSRAARLNALLN
jgi:hypothetical protein